MEPGESKVRDPTVDDDKNFPTLEKLFKITNTHVCDGIARISTPVEFIWKVDVNYESVICGDSIWSPSFFLNFDYNVHQWNLQLFPKGNTLQSKDYISLYLHHFGTADIEIQFTLAIININSEKIFEKKYSELFKPKTAFGSEKFYIYQKLFDPKCSLLQNDLISISCRIESKESIISKSQIDLSTKNEEIICNFCRIKEFNKFEKVLSNKDFSDATLIADGETFYVHKCILTARSPVFEAMFKHNMKEKTENSVKINDIKPKVLQELIRFIYTGTVEKIDNIVCELLFAAEKYSVEGLKTLCEDTMCKSFTRENAIEFLCSADINNATGAKIGAIKWISLNLDFFLKKKEFKLFGRTHPDIMFKIVQTNKNIDISEESEED